MSKRSARDNKVGMLDQQLGRSEFLRLGGIGAGLAATSGLLSSCNAFVGGNQGGNGGSGKGGTLRFFATSDERAPLKPILDAYKKQNSDVKFNMSYAQTDELNARLRTQLSSNTAADMFRVAPGSGAPTAVKILGPQGLLADLSNEPWVSKVPKEILTLCQANGKTYAFPANRTVIATFYNKKVFEDLNIKVPNTWDQFLAVCAEIKKAGTTPIALGLSAPTIIQLTTYALVASTVYASDHNFDQQMQSGKATFAGSSGWKEALQKFLELNKRGYFNSSPLGTSFDQALKSVASGKAAMITIVSASFPALAGYGGGSDKFGVFATPGINDPSKIMIPASPIDTFGVNAKSQQANKAKAVLKFMAEPQQASKFARLSTSLPGLKLDNAKVTPILKPMMKYLNANRSVPYMNHRWPNPEVQQALFTVGQQLFTGGITVDGALKKMDQAYQKGTG